MLTGFFLPHRTILLLFFQHTTQTGSFTLIQPGFTLIQSGKNRGFFFSYLYHQQKAGSGKPFLNKRL